MGLNTFTNVCVDSSRTVLDPSIHIYIMLIAAKVYYSIIDLSIHICVDSSRTVLEHHRSFIPSALVSQLEKKQSQGSPWELNPGPPALAASDRVNIQSPLFRYVAYKLAYCLPRLSDPGFSDCTCEHG